jgi:hypothetical protein
MAAGWPADKNTIDQRAGQVVIALRQALDEVVGFKSFLDRTPDPTLAALGYSEGDIATLKSGITDLATLRALAHAQATQPAPNDFFFFAKNLTGVL